MKDSRVLSALLGLVVLLTGLPAVAQTGETFDAQIDALRADLKSDKPSIIREAMQFKPDEEKAFWPVYREYDAEVTRANDDLVALSKKYSDKFGTITEADARQLTLAAFEIQSRKLDIRKRYFARLSETTTPLLAAKFFQLEYRLELLFNLKLASELPVLLYQSSLPLTPAEQKRQ